MQLLEVSICPSAVPINAFLCVSRHFFVGPRCHFSVRFWNLATLRLLTRKFVIRTSLCTRQRDWLIKRLRGFLQINLGHQFCPRGLQFLFLPCCCRCRPSIQIKTDLSCDERTDILNLVSPILFVVEPSRTVCPTEHLQGGACTSSFPEEPLALQDSAKSSATCAVVDVSMSGHSDLRNL